MTAREFAAAVDGLGKLGTMLGVPSEILWEDIPGWTQSKVDRAMKARDAAEDLSGILGRPRPNGQSPNVPPATDNSSPTSVQPAP